MSVVRVTSARLNASTRPVSMSVRLVPPTSGVNTSFDSPNVPWHDAHRASQTFSPLATLPDPAGNPVKSGRTSMSHARISAGVAGRPTPGNSAPAFAGATKSNVASAVTPAQTGAQSINLRIRHFPVLAHLPRLDRVVVVNRSGPAHLAQLVDL